jgi:hypothetical protein
MPGDSITVETEKDSFAVPRDNVVELMRYLQEHGGNEAFEMFELALSNPIARALPSTEQKKQIYLALRQWLLEPEATEQIGPHLMALMTEIETVDLKDEKFGG